jgi:hypothetical protein
MKLPNLFQLALQWFFGTPERAINQAYRAAMKIKDIEDQHFGGNRVSREFSPYGDTAFQSLRAEVEGYLQVINIRKAEFQVSRLLSILSNLGNFNSQLKENSGEILSVGQAGLLLEKLSFIDSVVSKYQRQERVFVAEQLGYNELGKVPRIAPDKEIVNLDILNGDSNKYQKAMDKTGLLPRSIFNTFTRIKDEINPQTEDEEATILRQYRISRYKTTVSVKFILLLIIVPLVAHQLSKTLLITPVLNNYFKRHEQFVFINRDLEEEAFQELRNFEEGLHFKGRIGLAPKLNEEQIEEAVRKRAQELSEEFRGRGIDAIANIFSDLIYLVAFGVVIAFSRQEIAIVKSFFDGIVYKLSDSAKAFLIILFTDVFVGFHSPHGWEIVLEGISRHFGIPESRQFNFLFIATFPVILDTVMKYWIFRYLNRISPSAVATYRNMNE